MATDGFGTEGQGQFLKGFWNWVTEVGAGSQSATQGPGILSVVVGHFSNKHFGGSCNTKN